MASPWGDVFVENGETRKRDMIENGATGMWVLVDNGAPADFRLKRRFGQAYYTWLWRHCQVSFR